MVGEEVTRTACIEIYTVGFGNTGREMVVGEMVLDKRGLLERVVTPVLLEVYYVVLESLISGNNKGEYRITVSGIEKVVDVVISVGGEVLTRFDRNG